MHSCVLNVAPAPLSYMDLSVFYTASSTSGTAAGFIQSIST